MAQHVAATYSIEEAKQKLEADAKAAAAEAKKLTVREQVADLRRRLADTPSVTRDLCLITRIQVIEAAHRNL